MATTPASANRQSSFRRYDPFAGRPFKRVLPDGPTPNRCLLIGEKVGREEAQRGKNFIGVSGRYMGVFLDAANVPRSTVRVTNCVWEFTEYSKPTAEEIARDHGDLVQEILSCNPEVIGLIGAYAVSVVLKCKPELDRVHGVPLWVPSLFGDELPREQGWVVLPITHPASCVHQPDSAPRVLDDFLSLGKLLDGEISVREEDPFKGQEDYRVVTARELAEILPHKV